MALLTPCFLDSSVLVAAAIGRDAAADAARAVMFAIAEGAVEAPMTAWHCCLEFYSVTTRVPVGHRLTREDALRIIRHNIFGLLEIVDLDDRLREDFFIAASTDGVTGGRIYDTHIAEIARLAGARAVVTDNVRHFASLARHGIEVIDAATAATRLPAP